LAIQSPTDTWDRYSLLAQLAESQLEARLSDADGIDTKAFGLIAGDAAGVAFFAAVAPKWIGWWGVPVIAILVSLGFLLAATAVRQMDRGPNLWEYTRELPNSPASVVAFAAFSDITVAASENEPSIRAKETWLRRGFWSAAASLVLALLVLVLQLKGFVK
jgi:hypothetical protein